MNILFTRFPLESAQGGAEVQTLSLMKGLRDRGHRVAFLGSCPVLIEWGLRAGNIAIRKLDIGTPPVTKFGAVSFAWRQAGMRRALRHVFDEGGPGGEQWDTVCMLSMSEKLLLTEHALAAGARVVWIEHDHIGRWFTRNPWTPRMRELSQRVVTVAVSDASREPYVRMGWREDRLIAIPDGIDLQRTGAPKTDAKQCHPEFLHIGCVARLTLDKGVHVLINAMAMLPDMRLSIVGGGRDAALIERAIERSPVRSNIRILPKVDDIGDFYRSIDALVLPSIGLDPFGMVVAEAMAVGLPTVVTDACGIAGYLRSGTDSIVVHPNEPQPLAEAMQLLRSTEIRERMGKAARETATAKFSASAMIDRYEALFLPSRSAPTS